MENVSESLDDLILGNVSETLSEKPNEDFAQRIAVAQAKLQQIQKDEKKQNEFDVFLARLIPKLSHKDLHLVLFLINEEIPSLTILAILSLFQSSCKMLCEKEFTPYVTTWADYSHFPVASSLQEELARWWTFILAADHVSTTTKITHKHSHENFESVFLSHIHTLLSRKNDVFKPFQLKLKVSPHLLLSIQS